MSVTVLEVRGAGVSHGAPRRVGGPRPAAGASRRPEPTLRLTARGRLVVFLLSLLAAGGLAWGGSAVAGGAGEAVEVRVQVVAAGDTLWGYAREIAAPGEDLRDAVARIVELNGFRDGALWAGQRILLPLEAGAAAP